MLSKSWTIYIINIQARVKSYRYRDTRRHMHACEELWIGYGKEGREKGGVEMKREGMGEGRENGRRR